MDFLTFVDASNRCKSSEDLNNLFEKALLSYGINGYIYSLVRSSSAPNAHIVHGATHSYPEEWMKHYANNNYVEHDPTYRQILKSRGVFSWNSLSELLPLSKNEKLVLCEAQEAGLRNGVSLSIHGPLGEVIGMGFIGEEPLSTNDLSVLYALSNQFHLLHSKFDQAPQQISEIKLSARQKEILQYAAAGKSRSTIACILGISEDTVDDHYKKIFNKLECNDRTLAVLKGIRLGLITV